eukprot:1650605-Pleurochrysis_carterae.AAC.2
MPCAEQRPESPIFISLIQFPRRAPRRFAARLNPLTLPLPTEPVLSPIAVARIPDSAPRTAALAPFAPGQYLRIRPRQWPLLDPRALLLLGGAGAWRARRARSLCEASAWPLRAATRPR